MASCSSRDPARRPRPVANLAFGGGKVVTTP
jgi:hypothetical protein